MSINCRALHFVLKVGNLKKNVEFFREKLLMTVLRHEVFEEGCEVACNGPYDNKWSKTMIGYGPEDNHFVLELTYNYSVGQYQLGNDLQYIKISLKQDLFNKILDHDETLKKELIDGQMLSINSPDGYKFFVMNGGAAKSDITEVCLSTSNLKRSREYWVELLKMKTVSGTESDELQLKYHSEEACLRLKQLDSPIDHKTAFGRIAFSCPKDDLRKIQSLMETHHQEILTPYLSLETPGKATVEVVILADPDGHEICFVGDEGFRELSQVDPAANDIIEMSMKEDKSDEWFQKKGKSKSGG